ncbi:MAG TPA: hypothetical protein VII56_20040 [Rhizomicrobium sp.]
MSSRDWAWIRETLHWIYSNRWLVSGQVLGLANFFAFMVGTLVLGGDAVNGHAANGHYFLDDKGHLTEVSRAVFLYSKWHVYSLFVTHPIAALCTGLLLVRSRRRFG